MFKKTAIVAALGLAMSATTQADYRWQPDANAGYYREAVASLDVPQYSDFDEDE